MGKYNDGDFSGQSDYTGWSKTPITGAIFRRINYQTPMKPNDMVYFYRMEFDIAGYQEHTILTVINDDTFSIVWDGHPSGKTIVVQGADLGNGNMNVNVRLEDT